VVFPVTESGGLRYRRLERSQTVPVSLGRVFSFFEAPENLALITPPRLGFRVVSPTPVVMEEGKVIDYRIRLCGLPLRWRSLIASYEPPFGFVDEQLQGPYAHWRHTHRFESCLRGTLVTDEVVYALPAGLPSVLDAMLHSLYVRPSLERIFDYRARFYADFFDDRCG
jgi:ligand-binding SRPBCC domain-containing protein